MRTEKQIPRATNARGMAVLKRDLRQAIVKLVAQCRHCVRRGSVEDLGAHKNQISNLHSELSCVFLAKYGHKI